MDINIFQILFLKVFLSGTPYQNVAEGRGSIEKKRKDGGFKWKKVASIENVSIT